ncbi:hypothetical protein [Bacillus wiedmannii]
MQYGLALQNEAVLNRLKDSGVKERLIKENEAEEKAHADNVAIAKQIIKEVTGE